MSPMPRRGHHYLAFNAAFEIKYCLTGHLIHLVAFKSQWLNQVQVCQELGTTCNGSGAIQTCSTSQNAMCRALNGWLYEGSGCVTAWNSSYVGSYFGDDDGVWRLLWRLICQRLSGCFLDQLKVNKQVDTDTGGHVSMS
ncbi:hypothetical protein AMTR_s00081p00171850 [Amborella trichopoda]|uniref:Uncharacterized protein n=1 Tax=Amborella trichopoda TaxID=13333 RepID=W1PA24_AMBTC|nr:hypothetical protein AMTR_s00081p00171850 [Amborella trichopoda]